MADTEILQREQKDAAGWLRPLAYLVVLAITLGFLGFLAWGLHRLALAGRGGTDRAVGGRRLIRAAAASRQPYRERPGRRDGHRPGQEDSADFRVAIIGAGFGGIGTAIALKRRGIEDFVILERADGVGGTWWANTYPGCAVRRPSHLYSLLVRAQPGLDAGPTPLQPEIRAYLERRRRHASASRRTSGSATRCRGAAGTSDARAGGSRPRDGELTARRPRRRRPARSPSRPCPTCPGLEEFEGKVFHSARWDHELRPQRQAGRGDRHGRVGDPVRARRSSPRSSSCTSSSARRRG